LYDENTAAKDCIATKLVFPSTRYDSLMTSCQKLIWSIIWLSIPQMLFEEIGTESN